MRKIIFLGSKPIGYKCLEFLINNTEELKCKVIGVFSNDNNRFGDEYSVRKLAEKNGINFGISLDDISKLNEDFDYIISVQYHLILKEEHIKKAKKIAINLHMAPLPEYRGCNQFSFAIYNQAKVFGTTIHQLEPGIDNGKIIAESRFELSDQKTVSDLYSKTYDESIKLFEKEIGNILNDNFTLTSQESLINQRGTKIYYRKDIQKLKEINLGEISQEVALKVNATAMPGFEPPFTIIEGTKYYILPENLYKK
jgi:methionyl-tRNA formyltransferase